MSRREPGGWLMVYARAGGERPGDQECGPVIGNNTRTTRGPAGAYGLDERRDAVRAPDTLREALGDGWEPFSVDCGLIWLRLWLPDSAREG